jgi:sugar/nucleoside kinase (ribokinase family)
MRSALARRDLVYDVMVPDLVTVGGLTIDNVISADGVVSLARVGGNAAYSAVGARCFVRSVGLVSMAVASFPDDALQRFASNGISLDGVARNPARLRYVEWFVYDPAGDRIERLRSLPGDLEAAGFSNARLTQDEVARWVATLQTRPQPDEMSYSQFRHAHPMTAAQVPATYTKAKGVHLAPSRLDVLSEMASHFGAADLVMTLDPGWQLADMLLHQLTPLLAKVDAFLPSAVELAALVPGAGVDDALRTLAGYCSGTVAVKRGREGSLVWDRKGARSIAVPALAVTTVDPTGAGDSWSGGFLAGLVETGDPVHAAHFGSVAAARAVSHFGADGALPVDHIARRAELLALMSKTENGVMPA